MNNPEKLATYAKTKKPKTKKPKKKPNTICVGHHYTQANTNNINKV
jgi:hypothetical protein